jgi:molecular chaperone Hsp33
MILGLGAQEAQSVIAERGEIEVRCEYCSAQYHFDAVDVTALFRVSADPLPPHPTLH